MRQVPAQQDTNHTVLVIDSGVGGMSIVQALQTLKPSVQVVYVADNAMFPYGEKSQSLIMLRLQQIIDFAIKTRRIDAVVIGCNTATVMHIDQLRHYYSDQHLSFVGVVPPVKTAAEQSQTGCFTVVATENTARSDYLTRLINDYAQHCEVHRFGAAGLADYAENKIHGIAAQKNELQQILQGMLQLALKGADFLVLGCTHYAFIQQEIAALLPKGIQVIEPSMPVAKRIHWLLSQQNTSKDASENKRQGATADAEQPNRFYLTQPREISRQFQQFLQAHQFQQAQVLTLPE